jgi:hypothetical protein
MQQHAITTAMALYAGGTLDLETAARQAGISPERLEHAVARVGAPTTVEPAARDRIEVAAD